MSQAESPPHTKDEIIWTDKMVALFGALFGTGFALLMIVPIAVGQALALGVSEAIHLYGVDWLTFLLQIGGGTSVAFLGVAAIRKVSRRLPWRRVAIVAGKLLFIALIVGGPSWIFWQLARMAYEDERQRLEASPPPRNPDAAAKALRQQDVALKALSKDGQELLARLDATANETTALRHDLAATIAAVEQERKLVEQAYEQVLELSQRQYVIQNRTARIRDMLGGQEPISRADLSKAGRTALWQGFVIGILTSVLGSVIFRWFAAVSRKWRRRTPTRPKAA
jgi:hypothetical protein